ncbi:MAG: hypothetical protein JKY37_30450 [Nannocystaceae bacterium]|nr:hypothetical protein [Nannocystaceae bacterium]
MRSWVFLLCWLAVGCGRGPFFQPPEQLESTRCGAVDFLFVIDNSESMQRHQDNLVMSFDPFVRGIRSSLDDVDDFHLGVVTTDAYRSNPMGCRDVGALVTSVDNGPWREVTECGPFAEGERYMTQEDDLSKTFACAANVGTDGNREEEPMRAMRRALLGGPNGELHQCNGDFIRDNALLMTVIITDEGDGIPDGEDDEQDRSGSPSEWFRAVTNKKGAESNAVVLSLINGVTPECPVDDPAFDGSRIAEFTNMFTHGFVGGICQPDYGAIFSRAVEEVDIACDEWTRSATND